MRAVYEKILDWKKQLSFAVVLGIIVSLIIWWNPRSASDERTDDIVGRWSFNYARTQSGLTEAIKGKTTYYSTGKYNVIGDITYQWLQDGHQNSLTYRTDGAGSWKIYDKNLIISLEDMKSYPIRFHVSGKDYDGEDITILKQLDFPSPDKTMAKGKSQLYFIQSHSNDRVKLEVDNPYGGNFSIELIKDD
jgi:hypothetical protein